MRFRPIRSITLLLGLCTGYFAFLNILSLINRDRDEWVILEKGGVGGVPKVKVNEEQEQVLFDYYRFDPEFPKADSEGQGQHLNKTGKQIVTHVGLSMVPRGSPAVWPDSNTPWNDRILSQLAFRPQRNPVPVAGENTNFKTIFMYDGFGDGEVAGQQRFLDQSCPVDMCFVTDDRSWMLEADMVLFNTPPYEGSKLPRRPQQVWLIWSLESPINTMDMSNNAFADQHVNWTASYRADSTVVTPYEKWVPFKNFTGLPSVPLRNYAAGKTKAVAWFVSNCLAGNKRMQYALKLKQHISVHIYGDCGSFECSRHDGDKCNTLLQKDYKFYLSFENSNCQHYITEKLYWNALLNNVVPIVMGARPEDYKYAAPPNSYIHVEDFPSPEALAQYLHKLDNDDDLYNQYFLWKGTGEFINTKFWCRLCAMLHYDDGTRRWYDDVDSWWRAKGTCTRDRWDNASHIVTNFNKFFMETDIGEGDVGEEYPEGQDLVEKRAERMRGEERDREEEYDDGNVDERQGLRDDVERGDDGEKKTWEERRKEDKQREDRLEEQRQEERHRQHLQNILGRNERER